MTINNIDKHDKNRGVELMLRGGRKNKDQVNQINEEKFNLSKVFSLFNKEFTFKFELNVKKK